MKKLIILIVIAVALLFSGCGLTTPDCPEIPECPDCICGECPDCVCPPGGGSCSCPSCPGCPDLDCPDIPVPDAPVIVSFTADPPILTCKCCCGFPKWGGDPCPDGNCNDKSTISWEVTGAVIVSITPKLEGWLGDMYVDATGSEQVKCKNLDLGVNTWTLTATNGVGFVTADVTITRESTLPVIDGVISPGEWDCAVEIPTGDPYGGPFVDMGTVRVLATSDYLYVAFAVNDSTDPRTDVTSPGMSDKFAINVNPTVSAPYGLPCELIFQIAADPATFGGTSSGQIDGFETYWGDGLVQEPTLPADLESVTLYSGGIGTTEWKIPLVSTPGDVIKVGGATDIENISYRYPTGLDWSDVSTYFDIVVY